MWKKFEEDKYYDAMYDLWNRVTPTYNEDVIEDAPPKFLTGFTVGYSPLVVFAESLIYWDKVRDIEYDVIEPPTLGYFVKCDVNDIADQVLLLAMDLREGDLFSSFLPGFHESDDFHADLNNRFLAETCAQSYEWKGSEIHPFNVVCPLVGGMRRRGRRGNNNNKRRRPRRRQLQLERRSNNRDPEDNRYRKPKKVIIRADTEVVYIGKGIGLPRMWDTIVRAYDTAMVRTRAANVMLNFLYEGTTINPVSAGASIIAGDGMRTLYGQYRVTGFDVDVTFTALEAFPVTIVLFPFGPFNTPTFTAVNTATLAEVQSTVNQRYSHVVVLGAITGGTTSHNVKFKVTMDQLLGETGIDWRADDNFVAATTGSPANQIGLFVGAYTETSVNWTVGIGVRMSFNTHVEYFSPVIN